MTAMAHPVKSRDELEPRKNFSIRLSPGLYESLNARRSEGGSMNDLIGDAIAAYVGQPDLSPKRTPDINPQIARDAVRMGPEAIPALKGIAKHASNRDQVALACVMWVAAARLVAAAQGPELAAQELAHSAHVAEESKRYELAVALWKEALGLDPNHLESANRLGQRLHHLAASGGDDIDRYREAERLLARVTFVDNHAKLFHGWSALYVARADGDPYKRDAALTEIEEALKAWAFGQRQPIERNRWLRQVRRLVATGNRSHAEGLVEFANRNAQWEPITEDDLVNIRGSV
jgi:tetratricopeptide (TPR) repeat protein